MSASLNDFISMLHIMRCQGTTYVDIEWFIIAPLNDFISMLHIMMSGNNLCGY